MDHSRSLLIRNSLALILPFSLALVQGCAQGSKSDDSGPGGGNQSDGDRVFSVETVADERGVARATLQLPQDTTKFSVTAVVDDSEQIRFSELSDSSGNNYLTARGAEVTFGTSFFAGVNEVIAPSRDLDPPLEAGSTFSIETEVQSLTGARGAGAPVTFFVNSKADPSLTGGRLPLNILYVGDIGQDADTKDIISIALQEFAAIYGDSANIGLGVQEFDVDGPVTLPAPFDGSDYYRSVSETVPTPAVNLFISGDIAGGNGDILGLAAGIPGPPIPSVRSAVAVSIFAAAGPDGLFSNEDVRILGETMAHEVGHFMGLFHPVDFSGDVVSATDPLTDTETCSFFIECLSTDGLTNNLMFFSPVSDGRGGFVLQNEITSQQRGVMNRYIVVD